MTPRLATPVLLIVLSISAASAAVLSSMEYIREHGAAHGLYETNGLAGAEAQIKRMNLNPERYYRLCGYLSGLAVALAVTSAAFAIRTKRASVIVGAALAALVAVASVLAHIRV